MKIENYVCTSVCTCAWSQGAASKLAPFFHVGPWYGAHVIMLGSRSIYLLSHLLGSPGSPERIFCSVRYRYVSASETGKHLHSRDALKGPESPPSTKNASVSENETTKPRIPCAHKARLCLSRCPLGHVVQASVVLAALGLRFFRSWDGGTARCFFRKG